LQLLANDTAMTIFIVAHVPLFALLFGLISSSKRALRSRSRIAVSAFLIVHVGLHSLLHSHPAYEFSSLLSTSLIYGSLIYGGGLIGLTHLPLEYRDKSTVA